MKRLVKMQLQYRPAFKSKRRKRKKVPSRMKARTLSTKMILLMWNLLSKTVRPLAAFPQKQAILTLSHFMARVLLRRKVPKSRYPL